MRNSELITYRTQNREIQTCLYDGTIWLTQQQMSELFDMPEQEIALHLKKFFENKEWPENIFVTKALRTKANGQKDQTKIYNLDVILAIGDRLDSIHIVQFHNWVKSVLEKYQMKDLVIDDEHLKQSKKSDYFDELLARIRDIRASEKRFYQKVRDLYATAIDYDKTSQQAKAFFKSAQNKMLYAVTGKTAAELIVERSNSNKENMGLTSWEGSIVRKIDINTAKNYLQKAEIDGLNRIVSMYLDYAEDQAKNRKVITMQQWAKKLDAFLIFNDREVLCGAGKISANEAKFHVEACYSEFNVKRKKVEAVAADGADVTYCNSK